MAPKRNPVKKRATLATDGRQIQSAKKRDLRGESVLNRAPQKLDWLVSMKLKIVYCRVLRTHRDGSITTTGMFGGTIRRNPARLYGSDDQYEYHEKMPRGEGWRYNVNTEKLDTPPDDWPTVCKKVKGVWTPVRVLSEIAVAAESAP